MIKILLSKIILFKWKYIWNFDEVEIDSVALVICLLDWSQPSTAILNNNNVKLFVGLKQTNQNGLQIEGSWKFSKEIPLNTNVVKKLWSGTEWNLMYYYYSLFLDWGMRRNQDSEEGPECRRRISLRISALKFMSVAKVSFEVDSALFLRRSSAMV